MEGWRTWSSTKNQSYLDSSFQSSPSAPGGEDLAAPCSSSRPAVPKEKKLALLSRFKTESDPPHIQRFFRSYDCIDSNKIHLGSDKNTHKGSIINLSIPWDDYRQVGDRLADSLLQAIHAEPESGATKMNPTEIAEYLAQLALASSSTKEEASLSKPSQSAPSATTEAFRAGAGDTTSSIVSSWPFIELSQACSCENLPEWLDLDQLQRGQDLFWQQLPVIGLSLYYQSLVPGFAVPQLATVLQQVKSPLAPPPLLSSTSSSSSLTSSSKNQRLPNRVWKATIARLQDTFRFIAECMLQPERDGDLFASILAPNEEDHDRRLPDQVERTGGYHQGGAGSALMPGGIGWKAALRVRMVHAKARRRLQMSSSSTTNRGQGDAAAHSDVTTTGRPPSGYYDYDKWGLPINQEDMAATLLAFAYNPFITCDYILGPALQHSTSKWWWWGGWGLSRQEQLDYLALWRYIGWLMGCETVTTDTLKVAYQATSLDEGALVDQRMADAVTTKSFSPRSGSMLLLPPLDPCGPTSHWFPSLKDPLLHAHVIFQHLLDHLLHPDETSQSVAYHLLRIDRGGRLPRENKDESLPPTTSVSERRDHAMNQSALLPPDQSKSSPVHVQHPSRSEPGGEIEASPIEDHDDFRFYFRAFICRILVGPGGANALQLPLSPFCWQRVLIRFMAYSLLSLTSAYARLSRLPWIRQRVATWHRRWVTRWCLAERTGTKLSVRDLQHGRNRPLEPSSAPKDRTVGGCPFASDSTHFC